MTTSRFIELISDLPKITNNLTDNEKTIIKTLSILNKKAKILDNIKELNDCALCYNNNCMICTNNHSEEFQFLKNMLDSV